MTENELLLSVIQDKIRQAENEYRLCHTGFLTPAERSIAMHFCKNTATNHLFFGGYADAERTVLLVLPDYYPKNTLPDEEELPIAVLHCETKSGSRALSHRDYLGSLLSLGIKREVIGDILVYDGGADIPVLKSILPYLIEHYDKAGSVPLRVSSEALSSLRLPEKRVEQLRESVASLRLDNMISAAFGISREGASEAIVEGRVFVNDMEAEKPDMRVAPSDKLVLRGMGKAIFREVCGTTRKGRISVLLEKYL